MTSEFVRKLAVSSQANTALLPTSVVIGLAAPIAVLSLLFLSMDLAVLGFCSWLAAMAWLAFALNLVMAVTTIAGITVGGIVLLSQLLDIGVLANRHEQFAFASFTVLVLCLGQLLAVRQRQRAQLNDAAEQLGGYQSILAACMSGSRECNQLIAADGGIVAINEPGLKMFGASDSAQLLGKNWLLFWDREQQKKLADVLAHARSSGSAECSASCRILTGEIRTWHTTFTAVQLHRAAPKQVLCCSRDVTDQLSLQRELHNETVQFSGLLNSIDEPFLSIDAAWNIRFINRHAETLFAKSGQDNRSRQDGLLGRNFWDVFPVVAGDVAAICLQRAIAEQTAQRCEHFYAPLGVWLNIIALPYSGGASILLRDISSLVAARQQAAEENARLSVAQDIAGFGDWEFDYRRGLLTLSARAVDLLQLGECQPCEHRNQVLERLHPEDRLAWAGALGDASAGAGVLDITVRMARPDGSDRHIHWVGRLLVDEQGRPQRMLGAVQDISIHRSAQQVLEHAQQFVRGIIDAVPQFIGVIDHTGKFVTVNRTWRQGWRSECGSSPFADNFFAACEKAPAAQQATARRLMAAVRDIVAGRSDHITIEHDYVASSGIKNYLVDIAPLILPGEKSMIVFSHNDITATHSALREAADNAHRLRELTELAPDIFWTYDVGIRKFTYISPAFERIYKTAVAPALAKRGVMLKYTHRADRKKVARAMFGPSEAGVVDEIEFRIFDAEGRLHWLSSRAVTIRGEDNQVLRLIGTVRDITDYKTYEQRLYTAALFDELTGLPNRKMLNQTLQQRVLDNDTAPFAVMIANLDRFKNINDTLGHQCGDELLVQAAQRLRDAIGERGYIARLGSDEFAILCALDDIGELIEVVMVSFSNAFYLQGEHAFLTASIGAASFPSDTDDIGTLLRLADVAMQRAKVGGRNNHQLFSATMLLPNRARLALENELHLALPKQQFELFYQGKFNLRSGDLVGAEALLRWRSPTRGLISPLDFIPLLEETGLILPVGEWILQQACAQACAWRARTGSWLPLAVNVSALQVVNRKFGEAAINILRDSGVPDGVIELELTESALMTDVVHGARLMKELKHAGFSIALDDFGTGYSSLSYLRKFSPNTLKIDRSFIVDLSADASDVEIVAGIIQLARALKISVVAEGIELLAQRRLLDELGCEFGQGFLFCKPLSVPQFEANILVQGELLRA